MTSKVVVLDAVRRRAFAKFASKHLMQTVLDRGVARIDFTRFHKTARRLLDEKSPLQDKEKRRVSLAVVHFYNKHPKREWVQRATLLHAMAGPAFIELTLATPSLQASPTITKNIT